MAIICIASTKGGVGKTSLAFSLAKDLNYNYLTNDMSITLNKYKKARYYPNQLPLHENSIYDFGGFENKYAEEILKQADIILLPTTNDQNSLMKSLNFIRKFKDKTILVFANMIENPNDAENIRNKIHEYFPGMAFTYLRRSKILKNALENGQSATELYNLNNQTQHLYKQAYSEYNKILNVLKKFNTEKVLTA